MFRMRVLVLSFSLFFFVFFLQYYSSAYEVDVAKYWTRILPGVDQASSRSFRHRAEAKLFWAISHPVV